MSFVVEERPYLEYDGGGHEAYRGPLISLVRTVA
jgi:hypothetical protein